MTSPEVDRQRYVEEFQRRLDTMTDFYQRATVALAVDSLRRDVEALHEPEAHRRHQSLAHRLINRAGDWLHAHHSGPQRATDIPGDSHDTGAGDEVIVIVIGGPTPNVPGETR